MLMSILVTIRLEQSGDSWSNEGAGIFDINELSWLGILCWGKWDSKPEFGARFLNRRKANFTAKYEFKFYFSLWSVEKYNVRVELIFYELAFFPIQLNIFQQFRILEINASFLALAHFLTCHSLFIANCNVVNSSR